MYNSRARANLEICREIIVGYKYDATAAPTVGENISSETGFFLRLIERECCYVTQTEENNEGGGTSY